MQNPDTYKFNPSKWMLALFTILLLLKSLTVSAQAGNEALVMYETVVQKQEVKKVKEVKNLSIEKPIIQQDEKINTASVEDKKLYVRRTRWIRYDGYKND